MSFIARWLNLSKDRRAVGLRPHRELDVAQPYESAYLRTRDAIETVLGAHVAVDDRAGGVLEAAFGLVNNERVRCSFVRRGERTTVRVEAIFPAGIEAPARSAAVDALCVALERND